MINLGGEDANKVLVINSAILSLRQEHAILRRTQRCVRIDCRRAAWAKGRKKEEGKIDEERKGHSVNLPLFQL